MSEKKEKKNDEGTSQIPIPRRTFTVELLVGIFTLLGVLAAGYQAIGLAGLSLLPSNQYQVNAEFDNISGLKTGASVEIAGVPIGKVVEIQLKDPEAITVLRIDKSIQLHEDDIAAVRTKGIIGDRYIKISRGASDVAVGAGETLFETESVVDIEDIIGKLVHSFGSDDEKTKSNDQNVDGL